ncbi:hypothetical protein DPEC_G00148140 [Dallia pectoralis]|uniref:Uncharacterized protein n=1 Tax=Dallia pectoralis TaxID=75939 RepID=A0ACC2GID5_DALPE|nr:hypothetical protein DPEC_G00148140 [Dallia pectoralis]
MGGVCALMRPLPGVIAGARPVVDLYALSQSRRDYRINFHIVYAVSVVTALSNCQENTKGTGKKRGYLNQAKQAGFQSGEYRLSILKNSAWVMPSVSQQDAEKLIRTLIFPPGAFKPNHCRGSN